LAGATTLIGRDLPQLVRGSQVVVRARVNALRVKQADARHWVTVADCERLENLRGTVEPTFRVSTPGGKTEALNQEVGGAPRLEVGDELVLFLSQTSPGVFRVTGWEQGAWRVDRAADGSIEVEPKTHVARVVGKTVVAPHRMSLEQLKREVAAVTP
jgi:hypothetical protein